MLTIDRKNLAQVFAEVKARPADSRPRLYAFILFDDRLSHRIVGSFVRQEYAWLDGLSISCKMVVFVFLDRTRATAPRVGEQHSSNPSLDVASRFGIHPDRLPGLLFFSDLFPAVETKTLMQTREAIFWPLKIELFQKGNAEKQFAELFALVQEARLASADAPGILTILREKLGHLDRAKRTREVYAGALAGVVEIVRYSGNLLEVISTSLAQSFGTALAQRYG